jgi:hypothetical protein
METAHQNEAELIAAIEGLAAAIRVNPHIAVRFINTAERIETGKTQAVPDYTMSSVKALVALFGLIKKVLPVPATAGGIPEKESEARMNAIFRAALTGSIGPDFFKEAIKEG